MGAIGCPETSVINYHYALRKIPKDLRFIHIALPSRWAHCVATPAQNSHIDKLNLLIL